MPRTKLATCCYCGTRATFVFADNGPQNLSCGSCGAPLKEFELLNVQEVPDQPKKNSTTAAEKPKSSKSRGLDFDDFADDLKDALKSKKKRKKKKKSVFGEVFDFIEDIFD